jgi:hypothetical protein
MAEMNGRPNNVYITKYKYKRYGLMRRFFHFSLGIIAGIYISQNYEVPTIESPSKMWEKFKVFMDTKKIKNEPAIPSKSE